MTKDETIDKCMEIDGWQSREGLCWLWDRAKEVPAGGKWVEVGVYKGRSFACVLSSLSPRSFIYGVDDLSGVKGYDYGADLEIALRLNLEAFSLHSFSFLQLSSLDASHQFQNQSVDVVFIDGAHDYEAVLADINTWDWKVKIGGMICGHDFLSDGVRRAVIDNYDSYEINPGDIWSVRL